LLQRRDRFAPTFILLPGAGKSSKFAQVGDSLLNAGVTTKSRPLHFPPSTEDFFKGCSVPPINPTPVACFVQMSETLLLDWQLLTAF
jgi:hypothetical protein